MQAFSDCLWRRFLVLMYCDLFKKKWFPNYRVYHSQLVQNKWLWGINNDFVELWCLVALGDIEIWVSSTSYKKSDIGWPQQPPTSKKVPKFNLIFHDSNKKYLLSKHQNKVEFRDLDDSAVVSSDFTDLRSFAASKTSTASTTSVPSMTSTASFHQKNTDPDVCIILAPKWSKPVPLCGLDHQKWYLIPFLSEAVEVSQC